MLKTEETAPDFALPSHTGEVIRLSGFRTRQNVVLFFYPKDDTPVCTKEACSFRDAYADFVSKDTAVLGISSGDAESHARFAAKHGLPFPLLVDAEGKVRRLFGISRTLGILPGRVTFLIDKEGVIRHVFSAQFQSSQHMTEALAALQALETRPV